MKKPKIKEITYTFQTEVGEVRVIWEPNGPDTINDVYYKTTHKVTVERDLVKGFKVQYQAWITRASARTATASRFASRFAESIKNCTPL